MHLQAFNYVQRTLAGKHIKTEGAAVLEVGSYIVNGTIRNLFPGSDYTGIDLRPGPGVDVVADGASYGEDEDEGTFDIIVSCEALEHYADPEGVILNAYRLLRPGGHLIVTAASLLRTPHGNDGNQVHEGEFYEGIDPENLRTYLEACFDEFEVVEDERAGDVYGWGHVYG